MVPVRTPASGESPLPDSLPPESSAPDLLPLDSPPRTPRVASRKQSSRSRTGREPSPPFPRFSIALAVLTLLGLGSVAPPSLCAQNTAGVPGPRVDAGHQAIQYRTAWDPDLEFFAQRLHYERSLNERIMLRGIVQSRETVRSSQEYDFFQAEMFVQLSPEGPRTWSSGLRFDGRIRERGSTGLAGVHWLNQFELNERLSARVVLLNFVQFGGGAESGVFPQTRLSLQQTVGRAGFGVESYSSYGKWSDLADIDDQSHQIGPFLNLGFGEGWSVFGGLLFGLTDASADTNFRAWLTKRF